MPKIVQWRKSSRGNEEAEPKQKQHPVADVTGDGSKVQCYKELYCIVAWNVRCRGPAPADPGYSKERQRRRPIYLNNYQRYKE